MKIKVIKQVEEEQELSISFPSFYRHPYGSRYIALMSEKISIAFYQSKDEPHLFYIHGNTTENDIHKALNEYIPCTREESLIHFSKITELYMQLMQPQDSIQSPIYDEGEE